ncbi:hypothetical protein BG003_004737 [Podila horticola]|nr:hypothetical protein BG003_004737 [Podila horticola]
MATSSLITENTKNNNRNHVNIAHSNNTNIPMSHTSPSSPPTITSVVSIAGMLSPLSSPPPPSAKAVMAPMHTKEHDLSMWQSAVNAFGLDQPSPEQMIQQQMQAQSRNIILQSMAVQGMGITEALKDYGTLDFSDPYMFPTINLSLWTRSKRQE